VQLGIRSKKGYRGLLFCVFTNMVNTGEPSPCVIIKKFIEDKSLEIKKLNNKILKLMKVSDRAKSRQL
jgi:hypothetical protein